MPLTEKPKATPISPPSPASPVQQQPNPLVRQLCPASAHPQTRIPLPFLFLPASPSSRQQQLSLRSKAEAWDRGSSQAEGARTIPSVTTAPAAGHIGQGCGRPQNNKQKGICFAGCQKPYPAPAGPPTLILWHSFQKNLTICGLFFSCKFNVPI